MALHLGSNFWKCEVLAYLELPSCRYNASTVSRFECNRKFMGNIGHRYKEEENF